MGRKTLGMMLVGFGLFAGASGLEAQGVRVGGQLSFADDADFGIGPRIAVELGRVVPGLWLIGSFDYFFPDEGFSADVGDTDYWELNGNVAYQIDIPSAPQIAPYFGGGINVAHVSFTADGETEAEFSDTELGLNLLAGLDFPLQGFTPFVEIRLEIEGGEQLVFAGGVTLP